MSGMLEMDFVNNDSDSDSISVVTVPKACDICKGSRKIIKLADELSALPIEYRMQAGIGFHRYPCDVCNSTGISEPECPPGDYPPQKKPIEFVGDQLNAINSVLKWFHDSISETSPVGDVKKCITLAGFAGTGKTTIIKEIISRLSAKYVIRVCAPTGKAAAVLRSKGVPATTLHKLVYTPETTCIYCDKKVSTSKDLNKKTICSECGKASIKIAWIKAPFIIADLVIVDEASMLNVDMAEDIESLSKRILYIGDHGQLEPIGKDPGIMRFPDIRLEKIHRQTDGSGIIQLAHHTRVGSAPILWQGKFIDARVVRIKKLIPMVISKYDIILCGYNKTRKDVNCAIRDYRGFKDQLPVVGERLICLQNDTDLGLYNGLMVTVTNKRVSYEYPRYDLVDDIGNEYFDIQVNPDQFSEERKIDFAPKGIGLFDFGNCITVHKAQGSEWDLVAIIEEMARGWDAARWRYTAITRASKRVEYWIPMSRRLF